MPVQVDRLGGQSYDQGEQMTMAEAIQLAQQYNAVPQRISSGVADPATGYSGVWAVPTANGFIPLTRSGAAPQAPPAQGGPNASQAPQQQQQAAPQQQMPPGWQQSGQSGPMSVPGAPPTQMSGPPSFAPSAQQAWSHSGPTQSLIGPQSAPVPQGPPTSSGQPPAYQAAPAQQSGGQAPVNINVNVPNQDKANSYYSPQSQAQSYAGVYADLGNGDQATQAYRQWLGDQAGSMSATPPPQQPSYPMGMTYNNPSAMNQPQYPYSPQFQSPYMQQPGQTNSQYPMGNSWSMQPPQGPPPYSPQLSPSWSNAGPPGFAGNAQWQGQRQAFNQLGIR